MISMLAQVFQIWEEKKQSQRKERTYSPGSRLTGTCTLSKMCTALRSFHSTGISVHWELSGKVPSLVLFPLLWLCNEQNPLELVHEVHMVFLEALFGQLGGAIGWHLTQPVSVAVYRPPCVFVLNILHILTRTKTMMNLKQKRQESDVDTVRRLLFDRSSVDSVQISSAAIPCSMMMIMMMINFTSILDFLCPSTHPHHHSGGIITKTSMLLHENWLLFNSRI